MQIRNRLRRQRGAALIEYGLLVAGVALVAVAAISILGHKTSDLVATVATVLPGAHADDNGPIASGKLVETTAAGAGPIAVDAEQIVGNQNKPRLGNNLGTDLEELVVEPTTGGP